MNIEVANSIRIAGQSVGSSNKGQAVAKEGAVSFQAYLGVEKGSLSAASFPPSSADFDSLEARISELSKGYGDTKIDEVSARKIVNILDKSGFLDRFVGSLIESSGKSEWVNDSMAIELKYNLGNLLVKEFKGMSWPEVAKFVMGMNLKIEENALGPMPWENGRTQSDDIHGKLNDTLERRIQDLSDSL